MANASRDGNRVPTILGALSTDGVTPTLITANPSTHVLDVIDGTTGSDLSDAPAIRDANRVTGLMAVSEADGITPIPLYVNASGELLTSST